MKPCARLVTKLCEWKEEKKQVKKFPCNPPPKKTRNKNEQKKNTKQKQWKKTRNKT